MNKRPIGIDRKLGQRMKKSIHRCLTESFEFGRRKDGTPLKRRRINQAIFDPKQGYAIWSQTDLEMVMERVVRGIWFVLDDMASESNADTPEARYLRGECYCPVCGQNEQSDIGDEWHCQADVVWQKRECLECGATWTAWHKLTRIDSVEVNNE